MQCLAGDGGGLWELWEEAETRGASAGLKSLRPCSAFQEAKYHMQRCIDSGLWVPNAKTAEGAEKGGEEAEAVYEEVTKESSEEEKGNP